VIADRLAIMVNNVYSHPQNFNSTMLALATLFFAVQIYCDFSGYSSIAIGAARVMGFKLMTNFNKPYQAKSIDEFWKRWHISLSTWFRDYLYISLGGNRVSIPRWYLNLFIVFLISGFWHGANWTFILWGALHGFYIVFANITRSTRTRFNKLLRIERMDSVNQIIQITTTFLLVSFAWIFFRSSSITDCSYIIKKIFSNNWGGLQDETIFLKFSYALSFLLTLFLFVAEYSFVDKIINAKLSEQYNRSVVFGTLILAGILLLGVFQNLSFIYFQF
jgi:D-alanyl-lipoteichoic acid acyltransferase DltB (MBOAT superfamily)